jgi:stress response protein YsnF
MGEEAVVGKEARVVEEVTLRKDVGERTETVRDTTRRTEVKVNDDRASVPDAAGTRTGKDTAPGTGAGASGNRRR